MPTVSKYNVQALIAYVLLVLVVASSAAYIRIEFNQAQKDRCAVTEVTLEAIAVNIAILASTVPDDQKEQIGEQLIRVSEDIAEVCE